MKCKLCQNTKFGLLFRKNGFEIKRCSQCNLVRTFGDVKKIYDEYHRDDDYKKYEQMFRNIFQKRYNLVSKFIKKGKVLEIGSATGTMLSIFKENEWEVLGIEPSQSSKVARKRGIKTKSTTFEKAKLPNNYYDVVIINHTLEHVNDPLGTLIKVRGVLAKGGIVYIDVPNFASLASRLAGNNWKYLLPEEHVHQFEPETLVKLVEKAGFNVFWQKTWSGIFDVANPLEHTWYRLINFQPLLIKELIEIPGNVISTLLKKGTSLAVIGKV